MKRFPDPVLVLGEWLPDLAGTRLETLRLYGCRGGRFEPIRFQVDERTDEGDWVFPFGKRSNRQRGNGLLDPQDVLLFMAKDAGEKTTGTSLPPLNSTVLEIELEDPVTGGRAWAYLGRAADSSAPLSGLPGYVRYDYDREEIATDCLYNRSIITRDGRHTSFAEVGATPPSAGGTGENTLDRLKFRIDIRFFFNLIPLAIHEEAMEQDVVAFISGPVRVVRRLEQTIRLPLGVKAMKSFTDVQHYQSLAIVPIEIQVPKGVRGVISSSTISFGFDFSQAAVGGLFRNSENPEPTVVDGRMSESEKRFRTDQDKWRIIYGPTGAMVCREIFPPEVMPVVEVRQRYLDDISMPLPPERYPGSVGYVATVVETTKSEPGIYRIFLDVYSPPHYREGDEAQYLAVRDAPLKIRIQGRVYRNDLNPDRKVGGDFK